MKLFAFGSNGSGQLAIGHMEDVLEPTESIFAVSPADNDEIVQIAAGGNHTLLLMKSGHVYAAGCNSDGRCGYPLHNSPRSNDPDESQNLLSFRRVILPDSTGSVVETFTHISATWEGSILVAATQTSPSPPAENAQEKVFVLGATPKGELGLGTPANPRPGTSIPEFPPSGTRITALASSMGHTVAVLSTGDVYGWGGSRKGQLGNALKEQKIIWKPERIADIPFRVSGAVCGREFTVLLGNHEQGELLVLGDPSNRWGILDIPASVQSLPSDPASKGYMEIGASWHGIYVHAASAEPETGCSRGPLLAWGRNDRGQLPPVTLPAPHKVAVGSEHVLALLPDRSTAAFGWGEHGNCGAETDPRGNVAGSYNVVMLPHSVRAAGARVVGVGAGCATSWLVVDES